MAARPIYEVTLHLHDIREVFHQPAADPFSERFTHHSYTSGIEFIANELAASRSKKPVRATLVLPPDQIGPGLEERTRAAVRRYCRSQLVKLDQELRMAHRRIIRSFVVALVAMFALFGTAALLTSSRQFIPEVIAEGLIIAGWVLLWFPLDELLSTLHYEQSHRVVYRRLMAMEVVILPAPVDQSGAA